MLIHLVPRMYACPATEPLCEVHDLESPELGLKLSAADLVGRRPFPNKRYLVANRRTGRKAMNGILIETEGPIRAFTTITRWSVAGEGLVTHRVTYRVLDAEMDAVTEDMTYWYAHSKALGGYADRRPAGMVGSPAELQPRMALAGSEGGRACTDSCDVGGLVVERVEAFAMHTLERARIFQQRGRVDSRIPDPGSAFKAAV